MSLYLNFERKKVLAFKILQEIKIAIIKECVIVCVNVSIYTCEELKFVIF